MTNSLANVCLWPHAATHAWLVTSCLGVRVCFCYKLVMYHNWQLAGEPASSLSHRIMNDIFTSGRHKESIMCTERMLTSQPLEKKQCREKQRRNEKQREEVKDQWKKCKEKKFFRSLLESCCCDALCLWYVLSFFLFSSVRRAMMHDTNTTWCLNVSMKYEPLTMHLCQGAS